MKIHGHQDIKILRPDAKGRIHLGSLTKGVSGYKVTVNEKTHTITLAPYAEIPLVEKWLYENDVGNTRPAVQAGKSAGGHGRIETQGSGRFGVKRLSHAAEKQ